jgi:S1-C subfamily serine protease
MPDYKELFSQVGVALERDDKKAFIGASFVDNEKGLMITRGTQKGSPAYEAGLDAGDLITSIDGMIVSKKDDFNILLKGMKPGQELSISYERFGKPKTTTLSLTSDPTYTISLEEKVTRKVEKARASWLEKN